MNTRKNVENAIEEERSDDQNAIEKECSGDKNDRITSWTTEFVRWKES